VRLSYLASWRGRGLLTTLTASGSLLPRIFTRSVIPMLYTLLAFIREVPPLAALPARPAHVANAELVPT
jgi:hypothetical protein